jgi:pyruvate,water dikinase
MGTDVSGRFHADEPPAAARAALDALPDASYAVRSSGQLEDLGSLSFAGQYATVLQVPRAGLAAAISTCVASAESPAAAAYLHHHGLTAGGMAVIVQQMLAAEFSGVAFTVNPLTGADTELTIEYIPGLGEALVSGQATPHSARWDWHDQRWLVEPEFPWLNQLADLCSRAQRVFGYPLDLEWAYADGQVWLLQARPVTTITHTGLHDVWTTANFRDGGVSAEVCTPYMWSLYEYVWNQAFRDFLVTSHLIKRDDSRQLMALFYGRPYWNLDVAKDAMAQTPGYVERRFDEEFGIAPAYEGDGRTTGLSPLTLSRLAPIVLAQSRLLKKREATVAQLVAELRDRIAGWLADLPARSAASLETLGQAFIAVTRVDYLHCQSSYFWQIFLNTIHQSLLRDTLSRHTDTAGYLELIGGLDNVSHLRPYADLWRISRQQRQTAGDPSADLAEHVARFGYHSDKELDVSYPDYWEQPALVADQLAKIIDLDDSHDPNVVQARQHAAYDARLASLRQAMSPSRFARLTRRVERMRRLLWWREELRDVSTAMYDVIRRYSLALGDRLAAAGVLVSADDIWFLKVTDLWDYLERRRSGAQLRDAVVKWRRYYESYRHFTSENEIGPALRPIKAAEDLVGIGCSVGQVTGRARVIAGLADIGRLEPGDILVTRFTDTGWTSKFALMSAVVTEYGGMLCHCAVVAREFGIPAVVGVKQVLTRIHDGDIITVDGGSGVISVVRRRGAGEPVSA